jgi:hypothetical protein
VSAHGEKRTRKEEALIAALLTCPTVRQAAQAAGISEASANRYMKDPAFMEAYRQARKQALDRALAVLEQGMLQAVAVLRMLMTAPETPAATRVRAALGLLELGLRVSVLEDQEARLHALERERGIRP